MAKRNPLSPAPPKNKKAPQTHQPGPGNTAEAKALRAHNHSPAVEARRAANAWHTNPLAAREPKDLRKEAVALMRTMYKPAYETLSNEEKRVNSISEKRKADNSYYLNWLNQQSELLNAHEDAARNQLLAAGQQSQAEVAQDWDNLHTELGEKMEENAGNVSNAGDASAFNLSAEAAKAGGEISDQRQQTEDQLSTLGNAATLGHNINMAEIAALEGQRVSDQHESLTQIGNQREETKANQAAEAAKTFKESLQGEVEKAQARSSIAASEATAAIEAKRFGLDASKAALDAEEFGFEKGYKNKKLGLENRELVQKEEEARIHTELEEGKISQTQAKIAIEKAELKNEGRKISNEGKRTPSEAAKAQGKQRELNQHINANILSVQETLHQNGKLRQLAKTNPEKLTALLHSKYGYNSVAIQIAMELYVNHGLSKSGKAALQALGYNGKYLQEE